MITQRSQELYSRSGHFHFIRVLRADPLYRLLKDLRASPLFWRESCDLGLKVPQPGISRMSVRPGCPPPHSTLEGLRPIACVRSGAITCPLAFGSRGMQGTQTAPPIRPQMRQCSRPSVGYAVAIDAEHCSGRTTPRSPVPPVSIVIPSRPAKYGGLRESRSPG